MEINGNNVNRNGNKKMGNNDHRNARDLSVSHYQQYTMKQQQQHTLSNKNIPTINNNTHNNYNNKNQINKTLQYKPKKQQQCTTIPTSYNNSTTYTPKRTERRRT